GIACLNVAGLFLARGSARGREIGTRIALGASRGRIGRQLLADSLLLAVAGGVLGAAVAPLAVRGLIAFLPHDLAAGGLRGILSFRLLTFAFVASVAAGLLSGLAPALHAGGDSLVSSLRERGGTGFGGVRLRKTIVTLDLPRVTDAASRLLVDLLGDSGRHARTTVGVASLPKGVAVEIELIAQF